MSNKDLHKIAPNLSKIKPKQSGFKVPENYFTSIEDGILAEIRSQNLNRGTGKLKLKTPDNYFDSLEDIVITRLKSQTFTTEKDNTIPKNYFDNLEENVLAKLKTQSKIITLKKVAKYIAPLAIAASFLLIFILNNNSQDISFETIASSEIEEFIDNGIIDYDAEGLASVFPDVELDANAFLISLSDDEVLDYLNEKDLEAIIFEN